MSAVATVMKAQFKQAHEWIEGTLQGITAEQGAWLPPSDTVSPVAAQYAHVVMLEDMVTNQLLKGGQPLMAGEFAGKTGISEPPPAPSEPWSPWGRSVTINLDELRPYAQAVYAATDEQLGKMSDEDYLKDIDLTAIGFGVMPVSGLLTIVLLNTFSHTGEMSVIKGLQGLKGYPL